MPKVLILGARAPVALDHARRFAAQGWDVLVGDSISCRISGWSRAVRATIALPPPRTALSAYLRSLAEAIDSHGVDLIVPTCEEAFYLARIRDRLPRRARIAVADFDTMRALHSKWRFLKIAADCGIPVPDSRLVANIDDARAWADGRGIALKPEYSRFGVHVRLYPDGMPAQAPAFGVAGDWVAQAFCRGRELCSYSVADRGRLLAHVVYRPTHRLGASSSYWFQRCEVPAIRDGVRALVEALGYTGQISFDWIEDADGVARALECNPRAISGVHLFGSGDDLPGALCGTSSVCVEPGADAPRMIAAVMLSAGLGAGLRERRYRAWRRDWRAARDVIAADGDRAPLLGAFADLGAYAWRAARQGCSLREAATRDIEWDGDAMAAP
jgi:predicted ATP-grasp superfamily ATP-dependent carboligase